MGKYFMSNRSVYCRLQSRTKWVGVFIHNYDHFFFRLIHHGYSVGTHWNCLIWGNSKGYRHYMINKEKQNKRAPNNHWIYQLISSSVCNVQVYINLFSVSIFITFLSIPIKSRRQWTKCCQNIAILHKTIEHWVWNNLIFLLNLCK